MQALLSFAVQIIGGSKFYRGAFVGLKTRVGNMELLVALGTSAVFIYSLLCLFEILPGETFFETNVFIISFVRLRKYIEEKTKGRALNLLKELFALQTSKVRILTPKGEVEASVNDLIPGDIYLLKTGDLVPTDGEIVEGKLELDESLAAGESFPVVKGKGDSLISGSLVINGYAKVKVKTMFERSYECLKEVMFPYY